MRDAFAHPVTLGILAAVAAVLALAAAAIGAMTLLGKGSPALRRELWLRLFSWCWLLPLMILPVLAGREATIAAVTILALLCWREFARATGAFRERLLSAVVVLGILLQNFAALDNWYGFFVALPSLAACVIVVATIPLDRPSGYIQRTALALVGYMLFGFGLAHLGFMANDPRYRPVVLMLLLTVALSDVAAFTFGKLLGGAKLIPVTSPGKTRSGAAGALLTTTLVVAGLSTAIFAGTPMDQAHWLLLLGLLVGAAAQAGDLVLSSIKRDIGIKDIGAALPGHGGVLDRFNSLLLVAPAAFHFIHFFVGIGRDQAARLITG
jgi:phosphatidate cytidylyltransferase